MNRTIVLAGAFALAFTLVGCASGGSGSANDTQARCDSAGDALALAEGDFKATYQDLIEELSSPGGSLRWTDEQIATGYAARSPEAKALWAEARRNAEVSLRIVINDPQCFSPGDVADAQTSLRNGSL